MTTKSDAASGRYWPLWGVAAGVLGYVGHLLTMASPTDQQKAAGASIVGQLDRTKYYIGVVAGFLAVFCLLVFAAGWRRWVAAGTSSLTAEMVPLALVASAGAMILAYGIKGMLATYLPGGIDAGTYPQEGLYTLYILDDLAPFIAWFGVSMAAIGICWHSLLERRLPLWIGVVSLLFAAVPFGVLFATGLPGIPGIVAPLWLIILGVGLVPTLRHSALPVRQPDFAPTGD
ncbi:MAG TPA: hypothetical protein VHV31_16500 [Nitrolancea sp.]|jgi:hypothetical protein|nr:hypothetical protein [Nitrolancea sp.]